MQAYSHFKTKSAMGYLMFSFFFHNINSREEQQNHRGENIVQDH